MRTAIRARWVVLLLPLILVATAFTWVDQRTHVAQVRALSHEWSYATFAGAKSSWGPATYPHLDWSDDGCSGGWARRIDEWRFWPLVDIGSFHGQCQRHDFGYRNYQLLERTWFADWWNPVSKSLVDDRFREDMRRRCRELYGSWWQAARLEACYQKAGNFHFAVHWFGN